jgi:aspartate 1-decarboxylase
MSFAHFEEAEARSWKPKVLVLGDGNKTVSRSENIQLAEGVFIDSSL